jgi:hypothetical protein
LGWKGLSGKACGMPGFRVCFDLLITILGTPEDGLAKLLDSAASLFYNSISRVSKWFFPSDFLRKPVRILISVHYLGVKTGHF